MDKKSRGSRQCFRGSPSKTTGLRFGGLMVELVSRLQNINRQSLENLDRSPFATLNCCEGTHYLLHQETIVHRSATVGTSRGQPVNFNVPIMMGPVLLLPEDAVIIYLNETRPTKMGE